MLSLLLPITRDSDDRNVIVANGGGVGVPIRKQHHYKEGVTYGKWGTSFSQSHGLCAHSWRQYVHEL